MFLCSHASTSDNDSICNLFRAAEKRYRFYKDGRNEAGLLDTVVDVDRLHQSSSRFSALEQPTESRFPAGVPEWMRNARIYRSSAGDGFFIIRCALSADMQLRIARAALCEWSEPPNTSNLELQHGRCERLWQRHLDSPDDSLLPRLSWVTLGYQYQWTSRTYDHSKVAEFPPWLAEISSQLAAACGYKLHAEAAIINYYHSHSTMGGHLDDAEACQDVPIVSISLGLPAVYLLGGETKATEPVPILLRTGDVVVQGGVSRRFYHGVPRVIALPEVDMLSAFGSMRPETAAFAKWLASHRINVNVRQVFGRTQEGQKDSTAKRARATSVFATCPEGLASEDVCKQPEHRDCHCASHSRDLNAKKPRSFQ
mmetsp:Transcript_21808/g.46081  ORF Transcript_21808/g.46081 Transcript_21808/m.46081 type:complete len:369 (-) Transcript_21808:137-1243(-)